MYLKRVVIISVGYRVKSKRGVEFRRWANSVLKQYILKGYAVNDNRIKQLGEVIVFLMVIRELPRLCFCIFWIEIQRYFWMGKRRLRIQRW